MFFCSLWLLAGTIGHDPWKPDDAIHLSLAYDMAKNNHWLIPRLAGDPWLSSTPLYLWVAALCGQGLQWLLPWHDAARIATTLFSAGFLWALARSMRHLAGNYAVLIAPLLAVGTLGFLLPLHDAQPAIVGVFGFSLVLMSLIQWLTKPHLNGILLGIGIGISFLGAGIDIALLSAAVSVVAFIHPTWRTKESILGASLAIVTALLFILPWPYLLNEQSPASFDYWWAAEKTSVMPYVTWFTKAHAKLLLWASWPLMPLAGWHLWLERRRLWAPKTALPLIASTLSLLVFFIGSPRPNNLLPALVPLAMLATLGAGRLKRGAANAFDWFGMVTFALMHALLWLGAIALITGTPAKIAKNFTKPAPGFVPDTPLIIWLLAILLTLGWFIFTISLRRTPWRAATRWSIGWASIWLLITALWLPWIDYGKSYRLVSADFSLLLGENHGCIARRNLGFAQRASLDYFNGIQTVRMVAAKNCRYLITQSRPEVEKSLLGWQLLRETSRPGDKNERLRLYRRQD